MAMAKTTAQKRKEAREARAADPYAYQRSQEAKARKKPQRKELPDILQDSANGAVLRMKLYIQQWPQQNDHDRDIVLLDIHRMLRELTGTRLNGG